MWHHQLQKWLFRETSNTFRVGQRTSKWITNMRHDLERWELPCVLVVDNPVLVKGKVPVYFKRADPPAAAKEEPKQ